MAIGRVLVKAKPAQGHPRLREWEIADVVVFVEAENETIALTRAKDKLASEHWELVTLQKCDRLIEHRVYAEGGDILAAYEEAQRTGSSVRVFSRQFPREEEPELTLPLRVSETFMDNVVKAAGGTRLPANGDGRIADYRLGDWIFELKDLQEEGLLKKSRQERVLEVFKPYLGDTLETEIDPEVLSEVDRRRFEDLLGSPIQKQVKSASKQIRATKKKLGEPNLHGGLIYLNTGYMSLPFESMDPMVERYVRKDTTQIEATFCISIWVATNGFDTNVVYRVRPAESPIPVIEALRRSFEKCFEGMMTDLVCGRIPKNAKRVNPAAPVTFTVEDEHFVWDPGEVQASWKE
jgi:hypothetical protein